MLRTHLSKLIPILALVPLLSLSACGDESSSNSSLNTWGDTCADDSECGELSCLCGICNSSCLSDVDCVAFNDPASTEDVICAINGSRSECTDDGPVCIPADMRSTTPITPSTMTPDTPEPSVPTVPNGIGGEGAGGDGAGGDGAGGEAGEDDAGAGGQNAGGDGSGGEGAGGDGNGGDAGGLGIDFDAGVSDAGVGDAGVDGGLVEMDSGIVSEMDAGVGGAGGFGGAGGTGGVGGTGGTGGVGGTGGTGGVGGTGGTGGTGGFGGMGGNGGMGGCTLLTASETLLTDFDDWDTTTDPEDWVFDWAGNDVGLAHDEGLPSAVFSFADENGGDYALSAQAGPTEQNGGVIEITLADAGACVNASVFTGIQMVLRGEATVSVGEFGVALLVDGSEVPAADPLTYALGVDIDDPVTVQIDFADFGAAVDGSNITGLFISMEKGTGGEYELVVDDIEFY